MCGQVWWPILGICPLHLTHPSAHSQQWTHTRSSGQPCCGARGAVGGSVPCSRVSPQSWYWRWREHLLFTPPTDNSCRTWESNLQPLGYKSNSLTIRPRLPLFYCIFVQINAALVSIRCFFQKHKKIWPFPSYWTVMYLHTENKSITKKNPTNLLFEIELLIYFANSILKSVNIILRIFTWVKKTKQTNIFCSKQKLLCIILNSILHYLTKKGSLWC